MSIVEFSAALRNKALIDWFKTERGEGIASASAREELAKSNINTLVNPTKLYRSAGETAKKTSFIITKTTVAELLNSMRGLEGEELLAATNVVFSKFQAKNSGIRVNRRTIKVGNDQAVFFNNISFDSITTLVNNILELKPGELAKEFEKGHVVGLATNLLNITANRISRIDARGASGSGLETSKAKEVMVKGLKAVVEYYKQLDFDSANIKPPENVDVYSSAEKILTRRGVKYLVELQPKARNQRSAEEVKATIGSIRKLFSPGNLSDAQRLAIFDKMAASIASKKFAKELLDLRSSPTIVDLMFNQVVEALEGKTYKPKVVRVPKTKVASKKVAKPDLREVNKIAKSERAKVESLISKLNTTRRIRLSSTSNLEAILRARINQQVAKNMGSGDSRILLNYRTGRLADSVTIDRLTESRAGMISVFYSYMKNPYATFSDGGMRQYPKSRDPKLLISKSIREIAAENAVTKLRSVLV
jgi:hypothetical protein